jgi:hypothetical protein
LEIFPSPINNFILEENYDHEKKQKINEELEMNEEKAKKYDFF